MDAGRSQGSANLFSNVLLLAFAGIGGYVWLSGPLKSARPPAEAVQEYGVIGEQNVPSRLWQDPLGAVRAYYAERLSALPDAACAYDAEACRASRDRFLEEHSSLAVTNRLQRQTDAGDDVLALPLIVPGGPYAEDVERRLRARYAVITALSRAGYEPRDDKHIGLLAIRCWPGEEEVGWAAEPNLRQAVMRLSARLEQSCQDEQPPLLLGYELFNRDVLSPPGSPKEVVLVVWVPDEAFSDWPLLRLAALTWRLSNRGNMASAFLNMRTRVVGPGASTTLRTMRRELDLYRHAELASFAPQEQASDGAIRTPTHAAKKQGVARNSLSWWQAVFGDFLVLSPRATAMDSLIDYDADIDTAGRERRVNPVIKRTIGTDDTLVEELIDELARRGVDVAEEGGGNHIVLLTESDTFYGRALPLTFAAGVERSKKKREKENSDSSQTQSPDPHNESMDSFVMKLVNEAIPWPSNIHVYQYLRGVDGQVPERSSGTRGQTDRVEADHASPTPRPWEPPRGRTQEPTGRRQFDYVNRLAKKVRGDMAEQDWTVAAVGILGSDVYDKLLLLGALRRDLGKTTEGKRPVFFTTDLDARLFHESELDKTRNVIVASHYGLNPDEYLADQSSSSGGKHIFAFRDDARSRSGEQSPVFRDGYQTSTYFACLEALGTLQPQDGRLPAPKVYEIGRHGPFELKLSPEESNQSPDELKQSPEWGFILETIVPVLAVCSALLLLLRFVPGLKDLVLPSPNVRSSERRMLGLFCTLVLVVAVAFVGLVCFDHIRGGGEPFSWNEGISVWPSVGLRLVTALVAIFLIRRAELDLEGNASALSQEFFGSRVSPTPAIPPEESVPWYRRWIETVLDARPSYSASSWFSHDGLPGPRRASIQEIDVKPLWADYLHRGTPRNRRFRYVPLAVLYALFGVGLILALGPPHTPYRGNVSFCASCVTVFFSVAFMIVLLFLVLDAACLCTRFIKHLSANASQWPTQSTEGAGESRSADEPQLADWLDIKLIGKRTEVVGRLIYYPILVVLILAASRSSMFDDWGFPVAIALLAGINIALAMVCMLMVRRAAERARGVALDRLAERRMTAGDETHRQRIQAAIERVASYRVGGFAPLSQQPVVQALLVPSGGFGLLAIIEYFI